MPVVLARLGGGIPVSVVPGMRGVRVPMSTVL